jgi:4-hydroxy-tetrahydrodipicolinate reductase
MGGGDALRVLLIGHGRMGRLIEHLASAHGCEIAGIVTSQAGAIGPRDPQSIDVAIDFSTAAAVPVTLPQLIAHGIDVVIGTTGWQAHEAALRAAVERSEIGVLASANFSLGVNVFSLVVEEAARQFAAQTDVGAWIHEAHHAAKTDAPSGTARMLQAAMVKAGYDRAIDVSSTRAGSIPGTHTVGFDATAETVTLTHTVRDRAVFAHGALVAARWLHGRRGWFTMRDMLGGAGAGSSEL